MPCGATQDGWVMVERSDRMWPTGEGNGKSLQYSALRTPWTVWKGKMIGDWKRTYPGWHVPTILLEISGEITPERMKGWSQRKNNTQLWMWLVIEARSDAGWLRPWKSSLFTLQFIEPFNFRVFSITGWGIGLDYHDIKWFTLETNRDHSVIFETVSKYCISDSFVDHDGYSISSKGFLPRVVDIMVTWVKFTLSSPF